MLRIAREVIGGTCAQAALHGGASRGTARSAWAPSLHRSTWLGVVSLWGVATVGCGGNGRLGPAETGDTREESSAEPSSRTENSTPTSENTNGPEPVERCAVATFENAGEPEPFQRLTATVVDQAGEPVADMLAQACGVNVCIKGDSNSRGEVSIVGDDDVSQLAFKYGDGLRYAQVALRLGGSPSHELGEQRTVKFPKLDPNNRFEGGKTLTSADAVLSLADDTETTLDTLSFADESELRFVATAFEGTDFPEAAAGQGFSSLWALGPLKTEFCPPAVLSLPNTADLVANSEVELLLLVTNTEGRRGRYGEWAVVATAKVTGDGRRIVTDEASGIPELGLIGVRPRE